MLTKQLNWSKWHCLLSEGVVSSEGEPGSKTRVIISFTLYEKNVLKRVPCPLPPIPLPHARKVKLIKVQGMMQGSKGPLYLSNKTISYNCIIKVFKSSKNLLMLTRIQLYY